MDQTIPYMYKDVKYLIHIGLFKDIASLNRPAGAGIASFYFINPTSNICTGIKTFHVDNIPNDLDEAFVLFYEKYNKNLCKL